MDAPRSRAMARDGALCDVRQVAGHVVCQLPNVPGPCGKVDVATLSGPESGHMILRWLIFGSSDLGTIDMTKDRLRDGEALTARYADEAAITRHAERDHRAFWAAVDGRRFTLIRGRRA